MATIIKRGTLYMGDEPLGFRSMPRKYDYKNTPEVSIRDTVQGKELRWVPFPNGLWVAKFPLLNYISWNDLERNGFADGKTVIIDGIAATCRLLRTADKPGVRNEWKDAISAEGSPALWGPSEVAFWAQEHGEGWGARVAGEQGLQAWSPVGRAVRRKDIGFRPVLDFSIRNQDINASLIGKTITVRCSAGYASGKLAEFTDYDLLLETATGSFVMEGEQFARFLPDGMAAISRAALDAYDRGN